LLSSVCQNYLSCHVNLKLINPSTNPSHSPHKTKISTKQQQKEKRKKESVHYSFFKATVGLLPLPNLTLIFLWWPVIVLISYKCKYFNITVGAIVLHRSVNAWINYCIFVSFSGIKVRVVVLGTSPPSLDSTIIYIEGYKISLGM